MNATLNGPPLCPQRRDAEPPRPRGRRRHHLRVILVRKSGRSSQILAEHPRVPCCDPQQRKGRPLGASPTLLPIPQRVNADTQRLRELLLCQASKPTESDDIFFWIDSAANDTFPLPSWNSARKILIGQLSNVVNHGYHPDTFGTARLPSSWPSSHSRCG